MQLVHEFSVPVPVEQAWQVLTDVERIAPCLPSDERSNHQQRTRAGCPGQQPGSPNRAASTRKAPGAVPCSQAGNRSHPGT